MLSGLTHEPRDHRFRSCTRGHAGGSWTVMFLIDVSVYPFPFLKIKTLNKTKQKKMQSPIQAVLIAKFRLFREATSVLDIAPTCMETQEPKGYALFSHILFCTGVELESWPQSIFSFKWGRRIEIPGSLNSGYRECSFLFTKNSLLHCSDSILHLLEGFFLFSSTVSEWWFEEYAVLGKYITLLVFQSIP